MPNLEQSRSTLDRLDIADYSSKQETTSHQHKLGLGHEVALAMQGGLDNLEQSRSNLDKLDKADYSSKHETTTIYTN